MYRVLHTDDSAADHEITSWRMSKIDGDIKFEWAESARQALQMLHRNHYDCLISDYEMPEMNGLELLTAVRKKYDNLPFIFLTGQDSEDVAADALRLGADDYFCKGRSILLYQRLHNSILKTIIAKEYRKRERLAQEARRESEERYRVVVENSLDAIVIIQDEEILLANTRLVEITGMDPDKTIGSNFSDFVHPHELAKTRNRYYDRLDGGNPPQFYESTLLRQDGKRIEVEVSATLISIGGRKADLIVIRDITRRREEERILVDERQLLPSIRDANPVAAFVIDSDHRVISWNRACEDLTGVPRDDLLEGESIRRFSIRANRPTGLRWPMPYSTMTSAKQRNITEAKA